MKHAIDKVVTHHLQLTDQEIRLVAKGIQNLRKIREEVGALKTSVLAECGIESYEDETQADFTLNTFHDTIQANLAPEADNDQDN